MAEVKRTIHVRVVAFDPATGGDLPVPGASVLCEDRGWLWDPDLSSGADITGADGQAAVSVTYDDAEEGTLNPFFTITVPEPMRKVPAGAAADKTLTLPDEWTTRHYVNHRLADIARHENPDQPLDLHVGVRASLRVAYSDFDQSGIRNPLALPEDTVGIHLADYDEFLFIDWLNPDDTLTGIGYDPRAGKLVPAGEHDRYPYSDVWPTAPSALEGATGGPWIDPPGAPVGQLGGGSFGKVGPIAVDPHGFVFMIDGRRVRRFYPDGTLCQTLDFSFVDPRALAVDQYRTLYVADAAAFGTADRIVVIPLGTTAPYAQPSFPALPTAFGRIAALAVVPTRTVDEPELLAVADSATPTVKLLRIDIAAERAIYKKVKTKWVFQGWAPTATRNAERPLTISLAAAGTFAPGTDPVALAAGPGRVLFVADRASQRVSRWRLDASGTATRETEWGGLDTPIALAIDRRNGQLYVAEAGATPRVQRFDAAGAPLASWAPATVKPGALAADGRGDLYVTDTTNGRVLRASAFDPGGTPRQPADPPLAVGAPWTPHTAPEHMHEPGYVALGAGGRLWVADSGNDRVLRFDRASGGELTPATGLTGPALSSPTGIAEDADGNVYVADSDHHVVRRYDATGAHVADFGPGLPGSGPTQFNTPRGLAVAQRTEAVIYVADSNNHRILRVQRNGTFLPAITTADGKALWGPEDVAVDRDGRVFIADTRNRRIVELDAGDQFVRAIALPAVPPGVATVPNGVAVDPDGRLLITDRKQAVVVRVGRDGTLSAWWDLNALLAQNAAGPYEPDLARQIRFARPARAVIDERGLLCVADTGNDRVRLVRTTTAIDVALFDLGEALPDISLRAVTKADWTDTLGLRLNVGDVSLFDDSHDVVTDPLDDFAGDGYERSLLLGAQRYTSSAINLMRVVRIAQRWYQAFTRTAAPERRWGAPGTSRAVDADIESGEGASMFLDINFGRDDKHGRGGNAWDDGVVAHEYGHKVFYDVVRPAIPFSLTGWISVGGEHSLPGLYNANSAFSEGWAEYLQLFFGSEYAAVDRVRGFSRYELTGVRPGGGDTQEHLYGGPEDDHVAVLALAPSFDVPARALESEGYVAHTIYQVHRALVDPEVLFADAPGYWHGFNANVTTARADRFDALIWKPLQMWPVNPTPEEFDRAPKLYFDNVLRQARALGARPGEVVQSLLELNNLAVPKLEVTLAAGGAPPDPIELDENESCTLVIRLTDTIGTPLAGYNVVFGGTAVSFTGAGPVPRHGVRGPVERATDSNGTVMLSCTAPALGPPGTPALTTTLEISYQPDFDADASFAPPQPGDDRETTLSRAYLYELRAANKSWSGVGNNLGVRVSTKVNFRVSV
jgi:sugar lactone lactonase YvrE